MTKKIPSYVHKEFEKKVEDLLQFLQVPYKNISLYTQSFVHKSILNEKSEDFVASNERLEFFGDAVLELSVTEMLYFKFPDKEEGELTDLRSAIVRGKNLANISLELNFNDYIILSKGETLAGGNENPYILANTLEAFLGAIYIDLGYDISKDFVGVYIFRTLDEILSNSLHVDPKSNLQEIVQSKYNITPNYDVLEETGLDHDKNYRIGVYYNSIMIGEGNGTSKKKAQKNAAENALSKIDTWLL